MTISTPGSYRLTGNLIVPNEITDAILVNGPDVGIDLNDFNIAGPVTRTGDATLVCTPASGTGSGVARALSRLAGISVRWNRFGGILAGAESTVIGDMASENGDEGIVTGFGSTISQRPVRDPVEQVREVRAIPGRDRRRAARHDARLADPSLDVPRGQRATDRVGRELATIRAKAKGANLEKACGKRNVGRDHDVACADLLGDPVIFGIGHSFAQYCEVDFRFEQVIDFDLSAYDNRGSFKTRSTSLSARIHPLTNQIQPYRWASERFRPCSDTSRAQRGHGRDHNARGERVQPADEARFSSRSQIGLLYEFDVVLTERARNPRLIEKIAREGVSIYPENETA